MSVTAVIQPRSAAPYTRGPQEVGSRRLSGQPPSWLHSLVLAWVVLSTIEAVVLGALPYVDFFIGMMIVVGLAQYARGAIRLDVAQYSFLGCILVGGAVGDVPLVGVWWAGKLGLIFLIGVTLSATPAVGPTVGQGLIVSGCIQSLACAGAMLGVGWCQGIVLGDGRVGTVLTGPGALWRTVTFLLSYCFLAALLATRRAAFMRALVGLTLSVLAIWSDGSRTALVILPLALLVVALWQFSAVRARRLVVAGSGLFCVVAVGGLVVFDGLEQHASLSRLTSIFSLNGSAVEVLEAWDWARLQGIRTAVDAIWQSPFVGNGLLTTVVQVDTAANVTFDTQVVHNGYLQVWGDLGILGLLAFVAIVWSWLPEMKRTVGSRSPQQMHCTCLRYASLVTLLVFGLSFLLHPLTVTLNDWIAFVGPCAVLAAQRKAGRMQQPGGPLK
jgi:hypothetical protein